MSVLERIENLLRRTSMPATKFGRIAVNDPRLVGDLRCGRQPRPATTARIEAAIARLDREEAA